MESSSSVSRYTDPMASYIGGGLNRGILFFILIASIFAFFELMITCPAALALTKEEVYRYSETVKRKIYDAEVLAQRSGSAKAAAMVIAARGKYNNGYSAYQANNLTGAMSLFRSAESYADQARTLAVDRESVTRDLEKAGAALNELQSLQVGFGDTSTRIKVDASKNYHDQAASAYASEEYMTVATRLASFDAMTSAARKDLEENRRVVEKGVRVERLLERNRLSFHNHRAAIEEHAQRQLKETYQLKARGDAEIAAHDYRRADYFFDRAENAMERFSEIQKQVLDDIDFIRLRTRKVRNVVAAAQESDRLVGEPRTGSMIRIARQRYRSIPSLLDEHDYRLSAFHLAQAEEVGKRALRRTGRLAGDLGLVERMHEKVVTFVDKVREALELSREPLAEFKQEGIFEAFRKTEEELDKAEFSIDEEKPVEALARLNSAEVMAKEIYIDLQKILRLIRDEKEVRGARELDFLKNLKESIATVSVKLAKAYEIVKAEKVEDLKAMYNEALISFKKAEVYFEKGGYFLCRKHVSQTEDTLERLFNLLGRLKR